MVGSCVISSENHSGNWEPMHSTWGRHKRCSKSIPVRIWWWDIREPQAAIAAALSQLSRAERTRLDGMIHAADRHRFLAGRCALRTAIAECAGLNPRTIRFRANRYGKLFLASPGPRDLSFSLSHSGDLVCVAVAAGVRVGVDVERFRPHMDCQAAAELCLRPAEQRQLRRTPLPQQRLAFHRMWCRKEALVKASGKGMHTPMHNVNAGVPAAPGIPSRLDGWTVYELKAGTGYLAALAVETSGPVLVMERGNE